MNSGGGTGWPQGAEYTGAVASEPDTEHDTEFDDALPDEADEAEERQPDPEREARRLVALAQIRQYPDPVLRMQAREVESFDDELSQLVERMAALMKNADGAGLAATQVGVLRRVFVMRAGENGDTRTLVNPELVSALRRGRSGRRGLPVAPGPARPGRAIGDGDGAGEGSAGS